MAKRKEQEEKRNTFWSKSTNSLLKVNLVAVSLFVTGLMQLMENNTSA